MLFNSFTFLLFFAVVLLVSRLRWSWRGKKLFLLLASYLFYAAWNPPFVVLLWISTLGDWFFAKWMNTTDSRRKRKLCLIGSLCLNLGMLGYFKYAEFLVDNFRTLVQAFGFDWTPAPLDIFLPVGISFYTFQTLSYTIDVYRRQAKPWHSFLDYALFVTFFPQLVAGPIVRAVDFLPQCEEPKRASTGQLGWGLTLMIIGIFNKVVIADIILAPTAQRLYDSTAAATFISSWVGTLAFAVQIFCDFAGYSTCAIGVAMCLGFVLPDNFRFPYAAIGFSDFWQRWHISLSTWLRDYLYISVGGNRYGLLRTYRNLMITMLLGGLWHGASWTFVVWGALHGGYLVVERVLKATLPHSEIWTRRPVRFLLGMLTFACVCVAWVFFRAATFGKAASIVCAMFGANGLGRLDMGSLGVLVITAGTLALHWSMRNISLEEGIGKIPAPLRIAILGGMLFLAFICISGGQGNAFIYFQF